jgi:recombination protein RecR
MDSLRRLEEIFAHFPGIGPRQARRFAYYLLGKSPAFIREFTSLIEEVKKSSSECPECHRLFIDGNAKPASHSDKASKNSLGNICSICADKSRDPSILMVVARDSDFESIEKSTAYKGLYFILGGTVPILDKEPDKRIRLKALLERVSKTNGNSAAPLKEIILSLNTTPDGEHTADIVKDAIAKLAGGAASKNSPLQSTIVTILGRGLSTGAELEYADGETIKNALSNRK